MNILDRARPEHTRNKGESATKGTKSTNGIALVSFVLFVPFVANSLRYGSPGNGPKSAGGRRCRVAAS
jgi:hypothetical protein